MSRPLNPKVCVDCGDKFLPNSGRQMRCVACKERPRKRTVVTEPLSPRKKAAREVPAGVAARLGARVAEINEESYRRFREERDG